MGHVEVHACINNATRSTPMHSVRGPDGLQTELASDLIFVKEIVRQATIFNLSFERAWTKGIDPSTPMDDLGVLADIQSGLFAAIITRRILSPERVRKHSHHPAQAVSQAYADSRGARLRALLAIKEGSPILNVTDVRNSYEHIDERIDELTSGPAASVTDWAISDGLGFKTRVGETEAHHRLRIFYPAGGIVFYDDALIDLYALDLQLLEIRATVAPPVLDHLSAQALLNSWVFGSSQVEHLLPPDNIAERQTQWAEARETLGSPIRPNGTTAPSRN